MSVYTQTKFFQKESEHPYGLEFIISTHRDFKEFAQKSIRYYTAFKFAESDKGKLKTNGFLLIQDTVVSIFLLNY